MKNFESSQGETGLETPPEGVNDLQEYGKEHPFNSELAKEAVEKRKKEIEAEKGLHSPEQMFSHESVRKLVKDFQVKDGKVFSRENGEEITDEQQVLEAKAATFIYGRAKQSYEDIIAKGARAARKDKEYWIDKTLERFSINGENTRYPEGKLVNALLKSNGHLEEEFMKIGGVPYQAFEDDNAFALLRLKFREQGQDISNYDCKIVDNPKNSVSKATINFDMAPFSPSKTTEISSEQSGMFTYGFSNQLNEMEKYKKEARALGDKDAAKYWRANLEMRQNQQERDASEQSDDINFEQTKQARQTESVQQQEIVEKKQEVNIELDEIKQDLERVKEIFTENSNAFDRALDQIDDLIKAGSTDIEDLQTRLHSIRRAEEELVKILGVFNQMNNLYQDKMNSNHESTGDASENSEFINNAKKKIYASDERVSRLKRYIAKVEEAMDALKKF